MCLNVTERLYTNITSFKEEHSWLSNFEPCFMHFEGHTYATAEHPYQASKTNLDYEKIPFTLKGGYHAGKAKRKGRKVTLRDAWGKVSLKCMYSILRIKFCPKRNPALALKLYNTYPCEIIEGNTWGDTFWGVCNNVGENHLGLILMKIRGELISYYRVVEI